MSRALRRSLLTVVALASAFTVADDAHAGPDLGTTWALSSTPTIHNYLSSPVATPTLDIRGKRLEVRLHPLDLLSFRELGQGAFGVDLVAAGRAVPVKQDVELRLRPSVDAQFGDLAVFGGLRISGQLLGEGGAGASLALAPAVGRFFWRSEPGLEGSVRLELSVWMPTPSSEQRTP